MALWFTLSYIILFLLLFILNTGTVTPYGSTCFAYIIDTKCHQIANIDHPNFEAAFKMLDGAKYEEYSFSVVLRRSLYYQLSFPFMKLLGFHFGGLLFNFILYCLLLFLFFYSKFKYYFNPHLASIILLTYPGLYYYIGLPYSYNIILFGAILIFYLLFRVYHKVSTRAFLGAMLLVGVLFNGYDYYSWFIIPLLFVVFFYKWDVFTLGLTFCILPVILNNFLLYKIYGISFENSNTSVYFDIINSYLKNFHEIFNFSNIGNIITNYIKIYFYSTFFILPFFFLAAVGDTIYSKKYISKKLFLLLTLVFINITFLFLFINLNPFEGRWDFRGDRIARIYQGFFLVFLFFFSSRVGSSRQKNLLSFCVVILNLLIVLSPYFYPKIASIAYHYFYKHGKEGAMYNTLSIFPPKPNITCEPKRYMYIDNNPQ
jgi:hypothetical protein